MIYFHVLSTILAERFETFVIFFVTHTLHTVQFRTFSQTVLPSSLFVLCFSKHERLLKFVARLARDSFFRVHTRRNRLAVATRLSALMRHATSTSFITAFAYISRLRTRKTVYHVVMSLYVVIHQVNSFFGFYLSVEHCPRNLILRKQRSYTL